MPNICRFCRRKLTPRPDLIKGVDFDTFSPPRWTDPFGRLRPRAPKLTTADESEVVASRQREPQLEESAQKPPAKSTMQAASFACPQKVPLADMPARAKIDNRRRKRSSRIATTGTAIRGNVPGASRQKPAQFEKVKNNDLFYTFY